MADIKPGGVGQKQLVDLLYMIVSSIKGICAKLDAGGGVSDTNYEALCYDALLSFIITDSKDNRTGLHATESSTIPAGRIISPVGVGDAELADLFYQLTNMWETLCEKLDADGTVNDTDYEANCFTATWLFGVRDSRGNFLGPSTDYVFGPTGMLNSTHFINALYDILNSIETLTEQLDADGAVTDVNHEALWYTANITLKVENTKGNLIGN